jgi:hypothetical protein
MSKSSFAVSLPLVAVLLVVSSYAQLSKSTDTVERNATSVSLAAQAFDSAGGSSIGQISDISVQGQLSGLDGTVLGTFTLKYRGGNMAVVTNIGSKVRKFLAFNGHWIVEDDGKKQEFDFNPSPVALDLFPVFTLLSKVNDSTVAVTSKELGQNDSKGCNKIEIRSRVRAMTIAERMDESRIAVCIDSQSLMVTSLEHAPRRSLTPIIPPTIRNEFFDYKQFGLLMLPTRIRQTVGSGGTIEISISSVEFNQNLQDSDFHN